MTKLILLSILAGILFGNYPFILQESRLNGFVQAAAYCIFVTAICCAVATYSGLESLQNARWEYVAAGGVLGAIGLIAFLSALSHAEPTERALLFTVTVVCQVLVAAIYDSVAAGKINFNKLAGFLLIGLGVYFIKR